jgi:hypothetical protein
MAAEAPNPAQVRRKPHRLRPRHDDVLAALRRTGCFYGPAAQLLGVSRSNLRKQIQGNSRLSKAVADLAESQLDVLEGTVWDQAVNKRDMQAARIILNARARHRGYGWHGDAPGTGDQTQLVIQHVTFNAVPTGTFFPADEASDGKLIEGHESGRETERR